MKVIEGITAARTANVNLQAAVDLQEQIRRRAYELYEQRGREDGHECEDWLQAEAELLQAFTQPLPGKTVKADRAHRSPRTKNKRAKPG
jgi:hypothetical protein